MPETCPDCGFPKAAAESDIDNFHRTDGPCFVATVLEPVGLSARMKCAERALARVKEERDAAQEHVKELRERIGTLDVDAYLPRAQDAEARVRELEQRLATQAESLDTAMRMEREARDLLRELRAALDADGMVIDLNATLGRIDEALLHPLEKCAACGGFRGHGHECAPAPAQPAAQPPPKEDCDCPLVDGLPVVHGCGRWLPKEGGE